MSLVTSGSYERFREAGGRRLSHVFDPRTGLPLETSLLSVSVADPCSARADALATAFLAMGEERARAVLSASFPSTEAVFIHLAPNGHGPSGHGPNSRGLSSRGLSEKITVSLTRGLQSRLRLADAETAFEIK
jgi:thiamine biosynthesis lipoprotein